MAYSFGRHMFTSLHLNQHRIQDVYPGIDPDDVVTVKQVLGATGVLIPGPEGPPGTPGAEGATGPTGASVTGPQGAPGAIGPTGPSGPQGDPGDPATATEWIDDLTDVDTSTVPPVIGQTLVWSAAGQWTPGAGGPAALDDLTDVNAPAPVFGNVLGYNGTEWIAAVLPTGGSGGTGTAGPTGPAGATGTPGATGATGPASTVPGPTGPAGPQGATGPAGSGGTGTAATGPTGATGAAGATGPSGPAGATGATGASGPSAVSADANNTAVLGTDSLIYVPAPTGAAALALNDLTDVDVVTIQPNDNLLGAVSTGWEPVRSVIVDANNNVIMTDYRTPPPTGIGGVAVGEGSQTDGSGVAVGLQASARPTSTDPVGGVAVGPGASAKSSTSVGNAAISAESGIAIGKLARAAIAPPAGGQDDGGIAIGNQANGTNRGLAIGHNADTGRNFGAVAIGTDSTKSGAAALVPDEFVLGTGLHKVRVPGTLTLAQDPVADLEAATKAYVDANAGGGGGGGVVTDGTRMYVEGQAPTLGVAEGVSLFGVNAGSKITTAAYNTAFGHLALEDATTGSSNTAVGRMAASSITTGGTNTVVGNSSAISLTTAHGNTIIGSGAGGATNGLENTIVGSNAGSVSAVIKSTVVGSYSLASGNHATAIGSGLTASKVEAQAAGSVAIGADDTGVGAVAAVANEIRLGTDLHTVKCAALEVAGVPVTSVMETQRAEIDSLREELSALRTLVQRCCGGEA